MRVVWSPLALDRISEASAFIARDNPIAAEKWLEGIFDFVSNLSESALRGRKVPDLERTDLREIFYGSFRIIYRTEDKRVLILTVRHGRRLLDISELSEGK